MASKKIRTMQEFAKSIGLSRPTVSKYFDDPSKVRASSRKKIEAALEKSNFRPSLLAVNLKRQNSKIIGVIVPDRLDPFYMALTREIEGRAADAGYLVFALSSDGKPDREEEAVRTFASLNVSGVAIAPLGPTSHAQAIASFGEGIPLVFMDSRLNDTGPFVGTDNQKSMSLITKYLLRTGSAPTYFDMPAVNANANERRNAYAQTMTSSGKTPMFAPVADTPTWEFEAFALREATKILEGGGFASNTVLCANDRLAFGVMSAAHSLGLSVGVEDSCDLRVGGHDNHPLSKYCNPTLTTVAQDYRSIGAAAVDLLFLQLTSEVDQLQSIQNEETLFSAELRMRDSA